jgi:hypothetical protein
MLATLVTHPGTPFGVLTVAAGSASEIRVGYCTHLLRSCLAAEKP